MTMLPNFKSQRLLLNDLFFGRLFQRCTSLIFKTMKKVFFILVAMLSMIVVATSCNVTRKVTTESSYFQRGDTAISITTRTIESYDATKKN